VVINFPLEGGLYTCGEVKALGKFNSVLGSIKNAFTVMPSCSGLHTSERW